jgi:hypothetical protein
MKNVKQFKAKPNPKKARKTQLLSKKVEHIDIKSFDARPIIESMAQDVVHLPRPRARDRDLQHDAATKRLLDLPDARGLHLRRRLHGAYAAMVKTT